jgi:hypothetical protein
MDARPGTVVLHIETGEYGVIFEMFSMRFISLSGDRILSCRDTYIVVPGVPRWILDATYTVPYIADSYICTDASTGEAINTTNRTCFVLPNNAVLYELPEGWRPPPSTTSSVPTASSTPESTEGDALMAFWATPAGQWHGWREQ